MHICFIGQRYVDEITNGVHISTLVLAREMARQGHTIYFLGISGKNEYFIDTYGITHRYFSVKTIIPEELKSIIVEDVDKIDIYCFQSVFIPVNYLLSRVVFKAKKPYVIFPRGGYNRNIFKRNWLKKHLYFYFLESRYIHTASGAVCISDSEVDEIRGVGYTGPVKVTYNPVIPYKEADKKTISTSYDLKKIIYLGRFDIQHKGLDLLIRLAKEISKVDTTIVIELYGSGPDKEKILKMIRKYGANNVFVRKPVYGEDKLSVLQNASAYIHTARWEGFGRSIAEAMMFGLPCIISAETNLAKDVFKPNDLELVLEDDMDANARRVVELLNNSPALTDLKARTEQVAANLFDSRRVALDTLTFLSVIASKQLQTDGY